MSQLKRSCGARFPVTLGEEAGDLRLAAACTGPTTLRKHQINSSRLACTFYMGAFLFLQSEASFPNCRFLPMEGII